MASGKDRFEVTGIIEFSDWYYSEAAGEADGCRAKAHHCLQLHLEKGIRDILWSCGRSVVEYQSTDKRITRFGARADRSAMRPQDIQLADDLAGECPLGGALEFGARHGMSVRAHLCMNRHYGGGYGNCMTSLLARRPEMWEIDRQGSPDKTRLCFALEEYVEERLAIIKEVIALGAGGVCLDFLRQPPMLRYHPALVDAYVKETGADPRALVANKYPSHRELEMFMDWCRFRAGMLTGFMRKARRLLREYELANDRRVPLAVRVSDNGLTGNMISGEDVETWCREGLVDEVIIHPLQWIHGLWDHDAAPYVDLGRRTGVRVTGGVNTCRVEGWQMNPVPVARRIMAQYRKGVAGISLYETNDTVLQPDMAEILAAAHDSDRLAELLADRAWLEKWPVSGLNANCGMDNHSGFSRDVLREL